MKKFINKHLVSFVFILIFVVIFVFGGIYSRYMTNQVEVHYQEHIEISIEYYTRNFELSTFIESPYLVHVTYGEDDLETDVYLDNQFQVNGLQVEVEISDNILVKLQGLINETPPTYDTSTFFSNYNELTSFVTVVTQGFYAEIVIEVFFNTGFTAADGYSITSSETYNLAPAYSGGPGLTVETYYMDGFIAGNTDFDTIPGASIGTCPAMQRAVDLLK